jgi:hypothetical protein
MIVRETAFIVQLSLVTVALRQMMVVSFVMDNVTPDVSPISTVEIS